VIVGAPQYAPSVAAVLGEDGLEVDWAHILHDQNPNVAAQQFAKDLQSARSALQPAEDRSALMHLLNERFGSRSRLKDIARRFPRSMVEFFAAFTFADISMAKGNSFLGVVSNALFRGSDIPYRSLETIEDKIIKACFPEGCKVMDLTRKRDGNQKVSHKQHVLYLYTMCTVYVFVLYRACTNLKKN
jgi:hypothetical protein